MWRRWNRERAITDHMPEVVRIANKVRRLFAPHIDIRDLVQAGNVGLVSGADSYHPSMGEFAPFVYFRIRGAIIDSQKRRTYREERNESLSAMDDVFHGDRPAWLDTDPRPLVEEVLMSGEIDPAILWAIDGLTGQHRAVFLAHVDGGTPRAISVQQGISLGRARILLSDAREFVAHRLATKGIVKP
jgi:RNA polymerase sigma factor (sigma-70 family)